MAALTALPALGNDVPTTAAQAQAGLGIDAGRTSSSSSTSPGRTGTGATGLLDAWDDDTAIGALTAPTLDAGLGAAAVIADATSVAAAGPSGGGADATSLAANGIPEHTLRAYQAAAAALASADPTCRLDWTLLAGIGRVESNHGRFAGAIVSTAGVSIPAVIGIRLDGSAPKTAVIVDSDGGRLDGDAAYDRAVGPMQFLPGSWVAFGADGDGDGVRNPQDIDDAALAAGAFLCSGVVDLSTAPGASAAVRRYNNSGEYVTLVLSLAGAYRSGFPVGAIPVVAPVGSVPVQPTTPEQPAAPGVVLGLPADPASSAAGDPSATEATSPDAASTDIPSPGGGGGQPTQPDKTSSGATTGSTSSLSPSATSTSESATTGTGPGTAPITGSSSTTPTTTGGSSTSSASTTSTGSPTGAPSSTAPSTASSTAVPNTGTTSAPSAASVTSTPAGTSTTTSSNPSTTPVDPATTGP